MPFGGMVGRKRGPGLAGLDRGVHGPGLGSRVGGEEYNGGKEAGFEAGSESGRV
jgi:hypothetical protein